MKMEPELAEAFEIISPRAEFMAGRRDLARVRKLRFRDTGFDKAQSQEMCALGWPTLRVRVFEQFSPKEALLN